MFDPSNFFERLFTILAIFFAGALLYWVLDVFARKLSQLMKGAAPLADTDRRITTIATLVRAIGSSALFFVGGSMILKTLQIDITPILTGAGILGVIASFSAQTLVRDIIAGLFILLENQYAPGMLVQLDEVEGVVEHISLRSTIIRDKNGCKVFVPNGGIRIIRVMSDVKRKHRE